VMLSGAEWPLEGLNPHGDSSRSSSKRPRMNYKYINTKKKGLTTKHFVNWDLAIGLVTGKDQGNCKGAEGMHPNSTGVQLGLETFGEGKDEKQVFIIEKKSRERVSIDEVGGGNC